MIAEKMKPYVKNNSAIRMMFEEGNRLRAIYGADKVCGEESDYDGWGSQWSECDF